jgi:hypothetical protein
MKSRLMGRGALLIAGIDTPKYVEYDGPRRANIIDNEVPNGLQ